MVKTNDRGVTMKRKTAKEILAESDYVQRTSEIIVNFGTEGYEWIDILTDCIRLFDENRKYMKNLLLHTAECR